MELALMTVFFVCMMVSIADNVNSSNQFRNFFNSIAKNNYTEEIKNRNILLKEARQEQQAFDLMKSELKSIRQSKSYTREENSRKKRVVPTNDAVSQSTQTDNAVSQTTPRTDVAESQQNDAETLLSRCLRTENLSDKKIEQLSGEERGRVHGCMNREYASLVTYSRRLTCPTKIRDAIEKFGIKYLGNQGTVSSFMDKIAKVHQKVKKWLKTDIKFITNAVMRLASLSLKKKDEQKEQFNGAWLMLKENIPSCIIEEAQEIEQKQIDKKAQEINKKDPIKLTMRDAIVQLASAKDESEAWTRWVEQCSIKNGEKKSLWKVWPEIISLQELEILKQVTSTKSIEEVNAFIESNKFSFSEGQYARDLINVPRLREQVDFYKGNYKKCLAVLYFSTERDVDKLRTFLEELWPELKRASQFDGYCWNFGRLYEVSVTDEHTPGIQGPAECQPGSEDFEYYINTLIMKQTEDMANVARSLYSPDDLPRKRSKKRNRKTNKRKTPEPKQIKLLEN